MKTEQKDYCLPLVFGQEQEDVKTLAEELVGDASNFRVATDGNYTRSLNFLEVYFLIYKEGRHRYSIIEPEETRVMTHQELFEMHWGDEAPDWGLKDYYVQLVYGRTPRCAATPVRPSPCHSARWNRYEIHDWPWHTCASCNPPCLISNQPRIPARCHSPVDPVRPAGSAAAP